LKFTEQELESLLRLLNEEDFKRVLGGLARFAEENNKILVMGKHDTDSLLRQQGKTQALVLLMESIVDTPKQLAKFAQPKER
jgi:hypothetical protein